LYGLRLFFRTTKLAYNEAFAHCGLVSKGLAQRHASVADLVREVVGCVLRDDSGLLSGGRIDGVIIESAEKHTYPQTHI